MIRFIFHSYVFRQTVIVTILFATAVWIANKGFDLIWKNDAALPLVDLNAMYHPPARYDNIDRIRMRFIGPDRIFLEANRKLVLLNSEKRYWYYDTMHIMLPENSFAFTNKIFFKFENSSFNDSIYLVVSNSTEKNIYWRQIFYSSVHVSELNGNSDDSESFRINESELVSADLLNNNDTLIKQTLSYYNNNVNTLTITDCTANSEMYRSICEKFSLSCRIIGLMGGDAYYHGYFNKLGYPSHAVCEVYSSRVKKWFVVDPSYGFIFEKGGVPLNAVEISDKVFFNTEHEIVQDSVLKTKRSLVGRDYYRFYDNIFYYMDTQINTFLEKILQKFFRKFSFWAYHYTNELSFTHNGRMYIAFKSFMYLLIGLIHINIVLVFIGLRLLKVKKPNPKPKI